MCGIHGFNFRDDALLQAMIAATSHRGPDAEGRFIDDAISLGHNRLKILDLSERAAQPMLSCDGNEVIVYNGEIYNFRQLRESLDYPFVSEGDTEVILALYRKYGHAFVSKLDGMFAFAIWDKRKQELLLARDPVGIKPLYYHFENKHGSSSKFIFSSEIKAILAHKMDRELDLDALNLFFTLTYVPQPHTMFKNIAKFPAAHIGVFRAGRFDLHRYWEPKPFALPRSRKEISELVKSQVSQSVKSQLISDRPVGMFLSGGLDSNVILERITHHEGQAVCFSAGFQIRNKAYEPKFNADLNLAKRSAAYFRAEHHSLLVSAKSFTEALPEMVRHMDEPIADATFVSMYCLAKLAKQRVDVALLGSGGDEVFGGYRRYRLNRMVSMLQRYPRLLTFLKQFSPRLEELGKAIGVNRFALFMFEDQSWAREALLPSFLKLDLAASYFETRYPSYLEDLDANFMRLDRETWLVDENLLGFDKATMAFGLEARVPLLDLPLIDLSESLPMTLKASALNTKVILKEAFRRELPAFIFNQPKRGWFSPVSKWLRETELRSLTEEALSPDYCRATKDLFDWSTVRRHLAEHINSQVYRRTEIFSLLSLQLWCRAFEVQPYNSAENSGLNCAA